MNWLEISSGDHQGCSSIYKGTIEEQTQLLESTESLMKLLDSNPILAGACQPTLWHTDLHMGNIFVAPDESSRIVSLVDFQSTSILPAFLRHNGRYFSDLRKPTIISRVYSNRNSLIITTSWTRRVEISLSANGLRQNSQRLMRSRPASKSKQRMML